MLAQVDHRLSDTTTPTPSCFQKEKSWQSVMEYSDETEGNIGPNDEFEQQNQQQQQQQQRPRQPRSVRRQTSTNTAATSSSGLSRTQYTSYENIPSTAGSASSASGIHQQQPPIQFNNPSFLGLPLEHQTMSSAAGPMPHPGPAASLPYQQTLPHAHPHTHQHPQNTYPYPNPYPLAGTGTGPGPVGQQFPPGSAAAPAPAAHHHYPQQQQMGHYGQSQPLPQQQPQQNMMPIDQHQHQHHTMPMTHAHPHPHDMMFTGRLPTERPIIKLSRNLIDTYKHINRVYEQEQKEKQKKKSNRRKKDLSDQQQQQPNAAGVRNEGYDDENYDYILTPQEMIYNRYLFQERLGKGSFGQVVRAIDTVKNVDVAIKIIKSKRPFQVQAKTEIEILTHLKNRDAEDEHNVVRLLTHFMYRNHQCLVFEMLSLNLYELLKNTHFVGVSLQLIRKFAKQILKSLQFLARPDVDVIHCDLKPENILLRHPKRSGVKVIDFGSSCRSHRRMYPYIQSRFYRSPEVLLGLPYTVAIDMWSLGCILFEMHTGEPLFSGSDQFDQMQKIVKILGMVPDEMLNSVSEEHRSQFFERGPDSQWTIKQKEDQTTVITPSNDPIDSLMGVLDNKINSNPQATQSYVMFVDLIYRMLAYNPEERISPEDCLLHPFIDTDRTTQNPPT